MKVQEFIKGLRDSKLCEAVKQIQDWGRKGVLQDGIVRQIDRHTQEDLNQEAHQTLMITERLIIDEAAARFVKLVENYI